MKILRVVSPVGRAFRSNHQPRLRSFFAQSGFRSPAMYVLKSSRTKPQVAEHASADIGQVRPALFPSIRKKAGKRPPGSVNPNGLACSHCISRSTGPPTLTTIRSMPSSPGNTSWPASRAPKNSPPKHRLAGNHCRMRRLPVSKPHGHIDHF
jgi:hypothetical protein